MTWMDTITKINRATNDKFAEAVLYTPKGGSVVELSCPFFSSFVAVDPETQQQFESQTPYLSLIEQDLNFTPKHGDRVAVRGVIYEVREVQKTEANKTIEVYLFRV